MNFYSNASTVIQDISIHFEGINSRRDAGTGTDLLKWSLTVNKNQDPMPKQLVQHGERRQNQTMKGYATKQIKRR